MKKRKLGRIAAILAVMMLILTVFFVGLATADTATTDEGTQVTTQDSENNLLGQKAIACGIAIGVAAGGGGIGMGIAGGMASEGIARQPEVEGKIRTNFMLGLVFIETAIIYALLVVILIIFVL